MDVGICFFPTDRSARPDVLAVELEERGFESLWVTEHTHIPTSRITPWPGGPELPEHYKRLLDPFVALSSAATVTSRLQVGTGVCLVAQHDPIVLAKAVASLDLLSAGRLTFGIGVGWNVEEMTAHGVDPERRREIVREKVLAMQRLWTDEIASFDGDYVRIQPSWTWPKPVQRPYPPIILGGAGGPVTFGHVLEYCDGWMPIHGRRDVLDAVVDLHRAAAEIGRDPATIDVSVFGVPGDEETLDMYRDRGIRRCLLPVPSADMGTVLPVLDRYQPLLERGDP